MTVVRNKILVAGALAFLFSCSKSPSKQEKPDMYVASELALLMRTMELEDQVIKAQILAEEIQLSYPKAYELLITAQPTIKGTIDDTYTTFATAYTESMLALKSALGSERQRAYNQSVKACVSCHEQFCQLPINRIEKLYIKSTLEK
ncbi:MAG: D-ribose pyranose/furanose isomerase RbsD [Bacteroidia bacterium]|jgi:D-ribose pyranose/furanose isomerase RbsD